MRLLLGALLALSSLARAASPDDPVFSTRGIPSGAVLAEAARDPKVPAPAAVLGHRIGDALTPHDALARYATRQWQRPSVQSWARRQRPPRVATT